MRKSQISLVTSLILASNLAGGETTKPKRSLKSNMNLKYNILPGEVSSFSDMFEKGIVYGRLRLNSFYWDWDNEKEEKRKDNYALGIGGSLIFKTGKFHGVSATAGLYTSQNPFLKMDEENIKYLKAGKDTLARSDAQNGKYGITVLGESYLQYDIAKTTIKFGRQLFHSVFTKSNDTKMIPNSFDGISIVSRDIPDSKIQLAYFQAQKLRDHTSSHDVITFKDRDGNKWLNNDDSAIHKGLTFQNLQAHGEDTHHNLIIATFENRTIPNLKTTISYLTVPDLISDIAFEAHYKIPIGASGWSATPGIRYIQQFDDGAGEIGGASLKGKLANWKEGDDKRGYDDPKNLDSSLIAGRVVLKNRTTKILFGYSQVEDKGDIVAPWRGFPTGGYTRAMAQYNWVANTKSYMAQAVYDFGKAGIVDGFKTSIRYAFMDFDDDKPDVLADRGIIHIDLFKKFRELPNLETKIRIGIVDSDDTDGKKDDTSYNEYRLEFNYLF